MPSPLFLFRRRERRHGCVSYMAGSAPDPAGCLIRPGLAVQRAPGDRGRGGLAKGDMAMITADDFTFLRRAIDIATAAIAAGDDPYGSLLAGPQGAILIEAQYTVPRDNDITAHPELKLARWAARQLGADMAA